MGSVLFVDRLPDGSQLLCHSPGDRRPLARDLRGAARLDRAGKEELQQTLVPSLENFGRLVHPLSRGALARSGELERGALASALRRIVTGDQPFLLELLELRINLSVARGPEEAGRVVDQLLDLVAGPRPGGQHPKN